MSHLSKIVIFFLRGSSNLSTIVFPYFSMIVFTCPLLMIGILFPRLFDLSMINWSFYDYFIFLWLFYLSMIFWSFYDFLIFLWLIDLSMIVRSFLDSLQRILVIFPGLQYSFQDCNILSMIVIFFPRLWYSSQDCNILPKIVIFFPWL